MHPEQIRKLEQQNALAGVKPAEAQTAAADAEAQRVNALVLLRRSKLEAIKAHIPLKTYYEVQERLEREQSRLERQLDEKRQEAKKQNRPQALPKVFFEQRMLKPKLIRIN